MKRRETREKVFNEKVKISVVRNEENVVTNIKFGVGEIHTLSIIEERIFEERIYGDMVTEMVVEHRFILCIDERPIFSIDRGGAYASYFYEYLYDLTVVLESAIDNNHELKFGTFNKGYFEIDHCGNLTEYFKSEYLQYPDCRVSRIGA